MNDGTDIARWIMEGDAGEDSRDLVFGILKLFPAADGEEIKRGIEIALTLHEAEIMEQQQRGDHG